MVFEKEYEDINLHIINNIDEKSTKIVEYAVDRLLDLLILFKHNPTKMYIYMNNGRSEMVNLNSDNKVAIYFENDAIIVYTTYNSLIINANEITSIDILCDLEEE